MTKKAGLTIEEVIALWLYTGPAFQHYNQHLRSLGEAMKGGGAPQMRAKKEHQYTTTIHAIASAVKKVARITLFPRGATCTGGCPGCDCRIHFRCWMSTGAAEGLSWGSCRRRRVRSRR